MKRDVLSYIVFLGMSTIFLSQGIWTHSMYNHYKEEISQTLSSAFLNAIELEIGTRSTSKYGGKKLEITPKEKIAAEKLSEYQGDTITIGEGFTENNMAQLLSQALQEINITSGIYIDLSKLDSIYTALLLRKDLQVSALFTLYNKTGECLACSEDSISFDKENKTLHIESIPIGTKASQILQMKVGIPPKLVLERMKIALIISSLAMLIVLTCLIYQLVVIRKKNQLLRQREQAVNGTIHDLKSPLASVYSMLQYFSMSEKDTMKAEMLQKAESRIRKLSETIEALLSSTRRNKLKIHLEPQEINLAELIEDITSEIKAGFPQKIYTTEIDNQVIPPILYADRIGVTSIFTNLIENALKYSDDGVQISITLRPWEKGVNITIKDTGWGIPKSARKNIFKMFYQVPRTQKVKGYGIGLSYVKRIIHEHGGKISFASEEGVGTTFYITLPNIK